MLNYVDKCQILKRLLLADYSSEDDEIHTPEANVQKLFNYEILEYIRRKELMKKSKLLANKFKVELIDQKGAFYGNLYILKSFDTVEVHDLSIDEDSKEDERKTQFRYKHYLYFAGKNKLLEDIIESEDRRYHYRSFEV
jgi:hypothetical protein